MKVKEIHLVNVHRLHLTVQCPSWRPFRTGDAPHLPRTLLQLFPDLTMDQCENDYGLSFEEECEDTEIPHLFEHLVMEVQGQIATPRKALTGETYWDWTVDPRGCFHVEVDYENEFLAIGAVRLAEKLINAIDQRRVETVDLEGELERLRMLAELTAGNGDRRQSKPGVSRPGPENGRRTRRAAPDLEMVLPGDGFAPGGASAEAY